MMDAAFVKLSNEPSKSDKALTPAQEARKGLLRERNELIVTTWNKEHSVEACIAMLEEQCPEIAVGVKRVVEILHDAGIEVEKPMSATARLQQELIDVRARIDELERKLEELGNEMRR